ncbi:hypothetical protein GE061_017270 [Apolygus lucorum]|uniref:Uncharacterized protein n=1 Tax=Apolygus lucorum TaxID=248454 RepID=A0A8S9XEL6_APOLU|nr:hypothetical protein GE061_017270 [Apolygus lucorum]
MQSLKLHVNCKEKELKQRKNCKAKLLKSYNEWRSLQKGSKYRRSLEILRCLEQNEEEETSNLKGKTKEL